MEIVLASRNKDKIRELQTMLSQYCGEKVKVLSLDDIGFSDEIEEDGNSFEENAVIKASVPASMGYVGVADDSGLAVDSLGGAPGIFSARYSGEDATNEKNNALLLENMKDVPDTERGAAFVSVVALVAPKGMLKIPADCENAEMCAFASKKCGFDADVLLFRGECRGEIIRELKGKEGFGYDPLFYIPEKGKTFAEMDPEAKNKMSHRGIAMRAFAKEINNIAE